MNKYALICEDNLTSAHIIKGILEKSGYIAQIAKTGKEALALLQKNKYDLMTLDILLPDENGIEIAKKINTIESAKDLPIIVISATRKEDYPLDFDNNVLYWLEKSFDMNSFSKTIEKIMLEQNKNKIEILHVENDKDLLSLIEITLSDIANVSQTTTLQEAREYIKEKAFDIIILDYVFPEGTSDKLIPDIKSGINKNAKIIMFSAYEENKILQNYVDEIIIKTNISFEGFKTCIEKYIEHKD